MNTFSNFHRLLRAIQWWSFHLWVSVLLQLLIEQFMHQKVNLSLLVLFRLHLIVNRVSRCYFCFWFFRQIFFKIVVCRFLWLQFFSAADNIFQVTKLDKIVDEMARCWRKIKQVNISQSYFHSFYSFFFIINWNFNQVLTLMKRYSNHSPLLFA